MNTLEAPAIAGKQRKRMSVTNGQDLVFVGEVIAEFSTQTPDNRKARWTELRLWETEEGNWIAESVGASTAPGERPVRQAAVIEAGDEYEMRCAAMDAWDWSSAAKALASDLGWNVNREVP